MSHAAIGGALFAVFFIFAALMYSGKLPALAALPLMASSLFLVGGFFHYNVHFALPGSNSVVLMREFIRVVVEEGMPRIWGYVITVALGAVLAELLKESGVSRTIIRFASELGGDNKFVMCILMTAATALLFVSLGGLGAVIMVAGIVLPVLLGIGVSAPVAGSVFLLGMSIGGAFNPVNWGLFLKVLESSGMTTAEAQSQLITFIKYFAPVFIVVTIAFIAINARGGASAFWAVSKKRKDEGPAAAGLALLSPILPVLIILGFSLTAKIRGVAGYAFPLNTALLIGVLFCLFTTGRGSNGYIQRLTKAMFDGFSAIAPVAILIIGIGMTIRVVWDPAVGTYIEPLLKQIIPTTPVMYVVVFSVLAPLALYRGPLNVWGMGIAVGSIMISANALPPMAIMGALYSIGMIQGVSDPTNTHNAWIAGFLGEDVNSFTRKTLPWTWALAIIGLVIAAVLYF